ncbi:PAAR domain-containing protein [Paraburkholderia sp.]|uniref:PAAR domain-containing protein n=1 Tax=Paraburkholderia sp. TaxID=1926495 RepID=UPI003D6FAF24
MTRYLILDGDRTTASGTVHANPTTLEYENKHVAHEGDDVACPACNSTGKIKCDGPRLTMPGPDGRHTALNDDLCICKCTPPPKLVALQQSMSVEA